MRTCYFTRKFMASSSPLVSIPLPSARETHFWYIVPHEVNNASLNQHLELLSPCERENVFLMRGDELQKRALLARVLVCTTLARYMDAQVSPSELNFRKNLFGKPEIGIDVEEKQWRLRNDILSFAQCYFLHHEVKFLHSLSDPNIQHQEFFKLWTLKEAYIQALGRGFSAVPFKTFAIRFKPSKGLQLPSETSSNESEIVLESPDDSGNPIANWQFALFEVASSHYAAICLEKDNNIKGKRGRSIRLKVWKTIPFVEDECVSGTDEIVPISGLA